MSTTGQINHSCLQVLQICNEVFGCKVSFLLLDRGNQFHWILNNFNQYEKNISRMQDTEYNNNIKKILESIPEKNSELNLSTCHSLRNLIHDVFNVNSSTAVVAKIIEEPSEKNIGYLFLLDPDEFPLSEDKTLFIDTVSNILSIGLTKNVLVEESNRVSQLLGMGMLAHDIKNLTFALGANVQLSDHVIHDLRNKLEVAGIDRNIMNQVQSIDHVMKDLHGSIEKVQRYSTLISDLAAGKKLTPCVKLAPMARSVQLGAAYLESEGREEHVAIRYHIQHDAPPLLHDEMYIFRIVQNLVSNAIHATSQKITQYRHIYKNVQEYEILSYVDVTYRYQKGYHIIEIQDYGIGMSQKTAERILSGNSSSTWEHHRGSGWGTKIALELAATHEGEITIQSELGRGATFTLRFPSKPLKMNP